MGMDMEKLTFSDTASVEFPVMLERENKGEKKFDIMKSFVFAVVCRFN